MREWLGISLQETRLSEKLTVRETIELFASFYREPRSTDEVLEQLQLTEKADAWVGKLPAASGSASPSRPRWFAIRKFCFWTSRLPVSIRKAAANCGTSSALSSETAAPCC